MNYKKQMQLSKAIVFVLSPLVGGWGYLRQKIAK